MANRSVQRCSVLLVAVLMVAGVACQPSRAGVRCRGGVARDASHLLVCQRGRWVRSITLAQVAQILVNARNGENPPIDVDTVASGLSRPWEVAFLPDGTPLVTERTGRLLALRGERQVVFAPADVQVVGEGGLMGLAVDPGYAANRRVYVCLRSTVAGGPDVRVARLELNAAGTGVVTRTDIVGGIPAGNTHVGCRLKFGPDNALWISTGDANLGAGPQSGASLAGKILRVTPDGAAAPGNPGGVLDPRIFTFGHRNPQGLAFRSAPGTVEGGRPYSVEHGPDTDDEVNRLVAGGNYGWNPIGGGGVYNQAVPMTASGAIGAVWRSGSPTVAPSGATFVQGQEWRNWNGALVVANLKATRLQVLRFSADGAGVVSDSVALTDRGRLRSVVQGPDGALYVVTDSDNGSLLRLRPRS